MEGLVLRAKYGNASVLSSGVLYNLRSRGVLKHSAQDIIAGDHVSFDENTLIISNVLERKNKLPRPLIANIDKLALVMSAKEPDFSLSLLLKMVTYANKFDIPSVCFVTKMDLVTDRESILKLQKRLLELNIKLILTSSKTKEGINDIKEELNDKITALFGLTGAGKSSLLNAIDENYSRKVGEYSLALKQGKHETKESILLPIGNNGYIADTPGFSTLALDLYKEDLATSFPGFKNLSLKCYYKDCLHINEPKCEVIAMVNEGKIDREFYDIYIALNSELIYRKERYSK